MPDEGQAKEQLIQELKKLQSDIASLQDTVLGYRQAEEKWKYQKSHLESLIQYSSLAIVTLDENHTIIACNHDFEKLFQYQEIEIIGKNLDEVVGGQKYLEEAKSYTKKSLGGEAVHGSGKRYRKDGTSIEVEFNGVPVIIGRKVVGAYGIYRDISDRKRGEEALKTLSLKDDLTGLYNRRGFFTLAEQGLKTAQRMGTEMLLIFGDLDNMKGINDTFGHKEGDRALVDISQILKETFRESDIIARIGGDEFVILAMNSLETSAEKLVNRFDQVLNDHHLQTKRSYKLSMSLGVACFDPQNPCSIDFLLAQGDKLMYENKQKKSL